MLATEETVFNKARNEEQYMNFFQNLFVETSNQGKNIFNFFILI